MTNQTLTAVPGLQAGHAHDAAARTGCTVFLGPFRGAAEVCGFATGTRELDLLTPTHLVPRVDALLLTGGSAFGLAAADGVMRWLEERGRGFDTGVARVPLVPAAVIFDLAVGSAVRRPDAAMGYQACENASAAAVPEGQVGAGSGATVGKILGIAAADAGGVGSWAETSGGYAVAALAVVNAFGDVVGEDGAIVAGARNPSGEFANTMRLLASSRPHRSGDAFNTTLAVVATDAPLSRSALQALARQSANALSRRISPVFTAFDGDIVFALSTAVEERALDPEESLPLVVAAQRALERAILRAVTVTSS